MVRYRSVLIPQRDQGITVYPWYLGGTVGPRWLYYGRPVVPWFDSPRFARGITVRP
jgi:hypothetical protein